MRKILCEIVVIALVGFLMVGCRKAPLPDGMPKLRSCILTIIQDGNPSPGIKVELIAQDDSCKWTVSGTTDASGKAVIATHGQYPGVPDGKYVVVLSRFETEGIVQPVEGVVSKKKASSAVPKLYSLVEKKYNSAETSPLTIEIKGKSVKATFDAGSGKKTFIRNINDET